MADNHEKFAGSLLHVVAGRPWRRQLGSFWLG